MIFLSLTGLSFTKDQIKNLTLYEKEKVALQNNSSLIFLIGCLILIMILYHLETMCDYRIVSLSQYDYEEWVSATAFFINSWITTCIWWYTGSYHEKKGGIFFVYGYGGTEKTFFWKTLSTAIRSEGEIVTNEYW